MRSFGTGNRTLPPPFDCPAKLYTVPTGLLQCVEQKPPNVNTAAIGHIACYSRFATGKERWRIRSAITLWQVLMAFRVWRFHHVNKPVTKLLQAIASHGVMKFMHS